MYGNNEKDEDASPHAKKTTKQSHEISSLYILKVAKNADVD